MTTSTNPITQKTHKLPIDLDDSGKINEFLQKNNGKKLVVVQGLGFVGAVMSLVCANALTEEYAVIGVDLASATASPDYPERSVKARLKK